MLSKSNLVFVWWLSIKKSIFILTSILVLIGLFVVFSVGYSASEKLGTGSFMFFIKQLIALCLGAIVMFVISVQDIKNIKKISKFAFCTIACLLVVVLFVGSQTKGAKRWIGISGFGTIQPSELFKPFYIFIIASFFVKWNQTGKIKYLRDAVLLHILICFLLFLEPDFGMIMTYSFIFCVCIFLSDIPIKKLIILFAVIIAILLPVALSLDHVRFRILGFFLDKGGDNYQTGLALSAIKNGGLFGLGFGEGVVKYKLPDVHNDFIFSVICEEMGMIFAIFILTVYLFLIYEILLYCIETEDLLSKIVQLEKYKENAQNEIIKSYKEEVVLFRIFLIVSACLLFFEVCVNSSVSLHLMPTKGMTLPFISYGGSSLVSHLILMGFILNFTKKRFHFLPIIKR